MKKSTLIFVSGFTILFTVYLVTVKYYPLSTKINLSGNSNSYSPEKKETQLLEGFTIDSLKTELLSTPLSPFNGRLKNDQYEHHLDASIAKGIDLIQNDYDLFRFVIEEKLVKADAGKGYQVGNLTHSHPYFTPSCKHILEQIGHAYEGLAGEGNFFTVSSATRTEQQQKALRRRNRNATDGESSHSFGVSFDISYIRFNGKRAWDSKAQKNLETVLHHFQQAGKIYVIKERKQSCYHVTVR